MRKVKLIPHIIAVLSLVLLVSCGQSAAKVPSESIPTAKAPSESIPTAKASSESIPDAMAQSEPVPTAKTPSEPETPKRVVAASKSLAELWLLAGGEVVGVTEDALELPEVGDETTVIGTITKPNQEAVLALMPDLVLLSGELSAHKQLQSDLEQAGISCLSVEINSFSDYKNVMENLTGLTGRDDLYAANVIETENRITGVLEQAAALTDANRGDGMTFLAMRVSATKNKTLKNDYFACEIFSGFGLANIAEDNSALDELNLEAVVAASPDYIFVIPQGDEAEADRSYREAFSDHPIWGELDAVKEGRVFVLPKELFQYKPNARWDEAYEYIYRLLQV